jgi:hypothetical protein
MNIRLWTKEAQAKERRDNAVPLVCVPEDSESVVKLKVLNQKQIT